VYATGLFLGWRIQRHTPWGFMLSTTGHELAWGLLALSLILMLWAALTIWLRHTTVNPYGGASSLVTTGPFAFSRNPIYLADMLGYVAITGLMGSWWPVCFMPAVWAIMRYSVIRHEEAHLNAKFGEEYVQYCTRVHRWLGNTER
jgi:protein-S-isoprenylcysteine O-methyltransferase Ste14